MLRSPGSLASTASDAHQLDRQNSQADVRHRQQLSSKLRHDGVLHSIPEHAVLGNVTGDESGAAKEPRTVAKKKRNKRAKRQSRLTQLGGMTDKEKSSWMLEHCKVAL